MENKKKTALVIAGVLTLFLARYFFSFAGGVIPLTINYLHFHSSEAAPEVACPPEIQKPTPTAILPTPTNPQPAVLPETPEAENIRFLGLGPIAQLELSPDGHYLVIVSSIYGYIYDSDSLDLIAQFEIEPDDGGVRQVQTMAWSPDSKYLAVALFSTRTLIIEAKTGEIQSRLEGQNTNATMLAWSPGQKMLASTSNNGSGDTIVWNVATGEILHHLPEQRGTTVAWVDNECFVVADSSQPSTLASSTLVYCLGRDEPVKRYDYRIHSISPHGKLALAQESGEEEGAMFLWSLENLEKLNTLSDISSERYFWDPESTMFAALDGNKREIQLYDVATGEAKQTFAIPDEAGIYTYTFQIVLRGSILVLETPSISLFWNIDTGELIREIDDEFYTWLASEDQALIRQADGQYLTFNVISGERTPCFYQHHAWYGPVVWSPNGRWIAAGEIRAQGDRGGVIELWDVASERIIMRFAAVGASRFDINGLAFSPDSRRLASISLPDTVQIWDVDSGNLLQTLQADSVFYQYEIFFSAGLAWSPDGNYLFTGLYDQPLLWDLRNETYQRVPLPDSMWFGPLTLAEFSDDGQYLICGNRGEAILLHNGEYRRLFEDVREAQWTQDGELLLLTSSDDGLVMWNASSNQEIARMSTAMGGTLSHDNRYFAEMAYDYVALWDISKNRQVAKASYRTPIILDTIEAAWAPDDSAFASQVEGTILIWDVEN